VPFFRPLRRVLAACCLVAALLAGFLPPAAAGVLPLAETESLTAVAAPPQLTYGDTGSLTGLLLGPGGQPLVGAPVVAEVRLRDGTWTTIAGPAVTDAAGMVSVPVAPQSTMVLRLRHDSPTGAASLPVRLPVHARLAAHLDRPGVRVGRPVIVRGTLDPVPAGAAVRLERWTGRRWSLVERVEPAADGSWKATSTRDRPGLERLRVVRRPGTGLVQTVTELEPVDVYRQYTYSVSTRGRIRADVDRFHALVAETYADPRGWRKAHVRFREVDEGGRFTVVLAQARYLPTYSGECSTAYSCRVGRNVIINQNRWRFGSPYFPGDLREYREMVVNHETGHWLGHGHAYCRRDGALAPVMQQQSKGMQGCRVNPWPLPREIRGFAS
jgi:hypothetical protein